MSRSARRVDRYNEQVIVRADEDILPLSVPVPQSVCMLRAVVEGSTFEVVAGVHGITPTAVERRIKSVAGQLAVVGAFGGTSGDAACFVNRLRQHRVEVLSALHQLEDLAQIGAYGPKTLSDEEIAAGAGRIRLRSHRPKEDLALYYILLSTGARPLEIARLEVRDYLDSEGNVRSVSNLREEVAINGRSRPFYLRSQRLKEAMDSYLEERRQWKHGLGTEQSFKGLQPGSRLFLSASGRGFEIFSYGEKGQRRYRCRGIQETYRKIFRYSELEGMTALGARHTVAARLYARGADEEQVGMLLGIAERSAVRRLFPRRSRSLEEITRDLL